LTYQLSSRHFSFISHGYLSISVFPSPLNGTTISNGDHTPTSTSPRYSRKPVSLLICAGPSFGFHLSSRNALPVANCQPASSLIFFFIPAERQKLLITLSPVLAALISSSSLVSGITLIMGSFLIRSDTCLRHFGIILLSTLSSLPRTWRICWSLCALSLKNVYCLPAKNARQSSHLLSNGSRYSSPASRKSFIIVQSLSFSFGPDDFFSFATFLFNLMALPFHLRCHQNLQLLLQNDR